MTKKRLSWSLYRQSAAQHVATHVAMYVPRYIANTPLGYTHRSDRTVTTTYPLLEATNKKPTFSY